MKASHVALKFKAHLAGNPDAAKPLPKGRLPVVVYGTDEFKADRKRGGIRIPGIGFVPCPAVREKRLDAEWLAIRHHPETNGFSAMTGRGNPFEEIDEPAVPHSVAPLGTRWPPEAAENGPAKTEPAFVITERR
jgi:hypothetical protein